MNFTMVETMVLRLTRKPVIRTFGGSPGSPQNMAEKWQRKTPGGKPSNNLHQVDGSIRGSRVSAELWKSATAADSSAAVVSSWDASAP